MQLAAFLINLNKTKQEEREKGLVGSLIEILPPDSLETIEFHLRVLSYLPKEVSFPFLILMQC